MKWVFYTYKVNHNLFVFLVNAMKLYWRIWRRSLSSTEKFCPAYSRSTSGLKVSPLERSKWIITFTDLDTSLNLTDWIYRLIIHACSFTLTGYLRFLFDAIRLSINFVYLCLGPRVFVVCIRFSKLFFYKKKHFLGKTCFLFRNTNILRKT